MPGKESKGSLGDRRLLDKIDKLRELGVSAQISLPQMVVAGDQSAGKSSVLESLTGFHFPRAVNLCTRHATEIICRREAVESVTISIAPHDPSPEKLAEAKKFHHQVKSLDEDTVGKIFIEAAEVMGIDSGSAFSRDVLRVEISGPQEDHLTVIDVPGMFENPTEGLTTKDDIELVKSMVRDYIKESRTIILAVAPCNADIANQKILTYAAEFDPEGRRTLGVLTKPDLLTENATKASVIDLVQGKRKDLYLGYCVVRNRGADDTSSSMETRNQKEKEYFNSAPWNTLPADRLGIPALRSRIQSLLVDRTKSELPKVRDEIATKLRDCREKLLGLGASRSSPEEQRKFLGKVVSRFTVLKNCGLDAYYSRDAAFETKPQMKLVTRIREMNEAFSKIMHRKGHSMEFEPAKARNDTEEHHLLGIEPDSPGIFYDGTLRFNPAKNDEDRRVIGIEPGSPDVLYDGALSFNIAKNDEDRLNDILAEPFYCSDPKNEDILKYLEDTYKASRGSELGTFGGEMLSTTFKAQAAKWQPMALAHVSNTILTVHDFVNTALGESCADVRIQEELCDFIDPLLRKSYGQVMDHVRFLLKVELDGNAMTYNPGFEAALSQAKQREAKEVRKAIENQGAAGPYDSLHIIIGKVNKLLQKDENIGQCIHDVLSAYYNVALDRFVDLVCQQAVDYCLLHSRDGPLGIISDELVYSMTEAQLDEIAGEDEHTKLHREVLGADVDRFTKALKVLKAGAMAK